MIETVLSGGEARGRHATAPGLPRAARSSGARGERESAPGHSHAERNGGARGQTLVEMALGTLVFVTVLIGGVYFAEVGFLSLKVQEAANSAMWDVTGRRMHQRQGNRIDWTAWQGSVAASNALAQTRYAGFDALSNGGTTVTQAFTRAEGMQVLCTPAAGIPFLAPPALATDAFPVSTQSISCRAQATLTSIRIPDRFADGQVQHWQQRSFSVCSTGRPVAGNCTGQLTMLLDDWGFAAQDEAVEVPLARNGTRRGELPYYNMAESVYRRSMTQVPEAGAGSRLAQLVAGRSPINEDFFFMSFRGRESEFRDTLEVSHGDVEWETTPWKNRRFATFNPNRSNCWLGRPCN